MKNTVLFILSAALLLMSSCGSVKEPKAIPPHTIPLKLTKLPQSNIFINMDYGVRLNVSDKRASTEILNRYDGANLMAKPQVSTYPQVDQFVSESTTQYMQTMGFSLNSDINTDYFLQLDITQFQVSFLSGSGWVGTVVLEVQIFDANRKQVYPRTTVTGRSTLNNSSIAASTTALNEAYTNALDNIDWNRLAYFLRRAQSASEEKNKSVQGKGDTALEHTIIRWFVDSTPKGADVQWRVVSSTPDVKNTNQNFLGSTPYESTESFDIKGLTFNNSGNIQIEVTCEKAGFITQKRRFNLRQVIEQKEISTKFNLVKEEY